MKDKGMCVDIKKYYIPAYLAYTYLGAIGHKLQYKDVYDM